MHFLEFTGKEIKMANPIAESILALFSGGAQGYVGARAKRQATEDENQRFLDQLSERRTERAQAGQEAAAQRKLTRSEAAASRAQRASEFGAEQKFRGEQLTEEKTYHAGQLENKRDLQIQRLNYEQQISGYLGQILELKKSKANADPNDLIDTLYMKTLFEIGSNPDIPRKELQQRMSLLTNITDQLKNANAPPTEPGNIPEGGVVAPPFAGKQYGPAAPDITTTTAPWLQNLIDQIGGFNRGDFIERGIRNIAKKKIKTLSH